MTSISIDEAKWKSTYLDLTRQICWARLGDPEMPGTQRESLPTGLLYCSIPYSSTLWTDSWWSLIMIQQLGLKVASCFFCYTNGLPPEYFCLICDSRPALTCSAHRGKQQASVSSSVAQGEGALDFSYLSQVVPFSSFFGFTLYYGLSSEGTQNDDHWLKQIQGIKLRIALFPRSRGALHDCMTHDAGPVLGSPKGFQRLFEICWAAEKWSP